MTTPLRPEAASAVPSVPVLDIPIYVGSLERITAELTALMLDPASPRSNRCLSATSAHGIVYGSETPSFRALLQSFYCNLPDGMPLVWVGRLKGHKDMERCPGPDFFAHLMQYTAATPLKHYFAGGRPGVAEQLRQACATKFGNHNIVGTYCPPFRPLTPTEWEALAEDIRRTGADIVWIGLSTPKQEVFASELTKWVQVHLIPTVGAAFDFHIGSINRPPMFIRRMGLEWLYRLLQEPRRLFRRYFELVPKFILRNAKDLMRHRAR